MPRRLLNIASVVCLVACVASIGLWVRSYWWWDWAEGQASALFHVRVFSGHGQFGIETSLRTKANSQLWSMSSTSVETLMAGIDPGSFSRIWGRFEFGSYGLFLPYWFLVPVFATLSAVPWIRPPRRFSLRTLFIAITFLAIVLGMIAWLDRAWIGK
jgi:hypothetical protein